MIDFDCPFCGKHFSFSDRFAGRAMFCTDCKAPLNVPTAEEIKPRVVVPPPLPPLSLDEPDESGSDNLIFPPLSLDEPDESGSDNLIFPPLSLDEPVASNSADFPLPPPPPPLPPQKKELTEKPKSPTKSRLRYWGRIGIILFVVGGLGLFLAFGIDWRGKDLRPEMLENIGQKKSQAIFEASHLETKSNALWLRSLEIWNKTGAAIDSLIGTLDESVAKSGGTGQRLTDLRNMIQTDIQQAAETEVAQEAAVWDAKRCRAEIKFYEQQENELQEQIQRFPNDRSPITLPVFDAERQAFAAEKSLRFDADWTENHFDCFGFPAESDNTVADADDADKIKPFYAVFDGVKRLYGRQSLRISVLERVPITILFPPEKSANPINRLQSEHIGCFAFSIRFPELTEALRSGKTADTGKISAFRVRFVYPMGHIDFETDSPKYCEALFYDGCGAYVPVEFPLSGDVFWKRSSDSANIDIGKTPIDRIEIRVTPLSERTTFWLDGIALTEKVSREPYDLQKAETRQAEIRKRDGTRTETITESIRTGTAPTETKPDAARSNTENLFQWILQTAQGRIRVRQGNETRMLDPQSRIPEESERLAIEEIDLTEFRNLTAERLGQLGGLKAIKRLNLSRTGLKNGDLLKLATLASLESLNLSGNELTFEGLPAIRTLTGLKELNLDGIRASVAGIDALATWTSLRSLSLSRSDMDNSDLIYLLPLADLETLDLSATKIGDQGLPIFRVFSELRSLNLSKTRITDAGTASLVPLGKLKELNVERTGLSNACLENLIKLKSLESVSVRNTAITQDGVRKIFGTKRDCFKFAD